MKKIYLLLSLFAASMMFSQNSQMYYSGHFLDKKNKAQTFLKILNKNTGSYELTDEEGFAIIPAKVYDTLVWNSGKNIQVVYGVDELKNILDRNTARKSVEQIHSQDYDSLFSEKTKDEFSIDQTEKVLSKKSDRYFSKIKKIKQKNDTLYRLKAQPEKTLVINGSFSTAFDVKSRNSVPKTQSEYVQGRSENGSLVWNGPETDEVFSFGPHISTLAYNNLPYEYDENGKLVPLQNSASPAKAYRNDLFKTVFSFSNQLNLNAVLKRYSEEKLRLSFDFANTKDQMYLIDQFDLNNSFKTKIAGKFLNFNIEAGFNFNEDNATNTNRIGLFNRAYQNSLLTPVSFSNAQNLLLSNGNQRSYSSMADNPEFLLSQENRFNYFNKKRQYTFGISRNWYGFKLNIAQSYDEEDIQHLDVYKPSTYGFESGVFNRRTQKNSLYNSNILGSYEFGDYDFRNTLSLNFVLNHRNVDLRHSLDRSYFYQRTSQDYLFNYDLKYRDEDFSFGANLGNSFYISNTSLQNKYWLPKINGYLRFDNLFNWYNADLKFLAAYTELSSEPDISKSYAPYASTLLTAQNAYQYFPLKEATGFNNLANIDVKEWKTGFSYTHRYNLVVEAEYFNRRIANDVFPVFENNTLQLKNLADHTYKGFELNFSYSNFYLGRDFRSTQKLSFYKYRDVADRVAEGYNHTPISGFSDIYKSLTQGEVVGAVMGSYFERNENGQLIIDEFGYPKKASGMKIIADPTPDFVMKFNHQLIYKMLTLNIDWEWKKGGQIWNGTQAALDYYGRSQSSADQRNIQNYVFQGVNTSGNPNQIPVDFYSANAPVTENRWTRYGITGVAENYVQNADYVRINTISLNTNIHIDQFRNALSLGFYVSNILLWQANQGADPNQNFYDQDSGRGLDFFNLPSYKTFGCTVSFKF